VNVLIIDTSSWISYLSGKSQRDIDLALAEGRVYIPCLTIAELLSGKLSTRKRAQLADFLKELPMCDCSFGHWARVGELRSRLLSQGFSVSTPDTHIAQSCLDLDGYLVSEDAIFRKIAKAIRLRLLAPS